ncbi:MAG TPA: hypothetical protein VG845_03795 [Dehalococcoidia bacterium]|nr:hypothetical protein [Dehalococcoidia bacterium]
MRILRFTFPALAVLVALSFGILAPGRGAFSVHAQEPTPTPTATEDPDATETPDPTEEPDETATPDDEDEEEDEDSSADPTTEPTVAATTIPVQISTPIPTPTTTNEVAPQPPAGPISAPNTGDAGLADRSESTPYVLLGLVAAAIIGGTGFVVARKRLS